MPSPPNFSFIWEDRVAGSGHLGTGRNLAGTLGELRDHGITAIVSLTERPLEFALIREYEFDYLHVPIEDFSAPTQDQIDEVMEFINQEVDRRHGTLVHCQAGYGRTGTILACFLVSRGMEPAEAIATVRRLRPGSLEVYSQEYAVYQFAQRLRGSQRPMDEGQSQEPHAE